MMKRCRTAGLGILLGAAALPTMLTVLSAGPAFGGSSASPPLTMEEVEIHGSKELPERLFAPAPRPERAPDSVRGALLRAQILAPISPWESHDEHGRTGIDQQKRDNLD